MKQQGFTGQSPLHGARLCTLKRVTGIGVLKTIVADGVSIKRFLVSYGTLAGKNGSMLTSGAPVDSLLVIGYKGTPVSNGFMVGNMMSRVSFIATTPGTTLKFAHRSTSLPSSYTSSIPATSSSSSMNLSPMCIPSTPSNKPITNMKMSPQHTSPITMATMATPNLLSSRSNAMASHVLFSSSLVNLSSRRNFSSYFDTDPEDNLIYKLCSEISHLYNSYSKDLSLFPSLGPSDIDEIRRRVMDGTYNFSSLEILSFSLKEICDYLTTRERDYPDVHIRYNTRENLVYVVKPTIPQDSLVFLAIANTLSSYIHDRSCDSDRPDIYKCIKALEPLDLLYKIDFSHSISHIHKDSLLISLKFQLDIVPKVIKKGNYLNRDKFKLQFFRMIESICNLPIIKGPNFQGSIPQEWGIPPVGGKLSGVLLDVVLRDDFDEVFANAFPTVPYFRNHHEAFIPLSSNKNILVERNSLEKVIYNRGFRGKISSIERGKGYLPFGLGLYEDRAYDLIILMSSGKVKLVDSRHYF